MIITYVIASLMTFYILYLAIMSLYRGHVTSTLSLPSKILGYPILAIGLLVDLVMNITIFTIVFFELPSQWLVTQRLKKHINESGYRGWLARYICINLLSPFDPSGNHCK